MWVGEERRGVVLDLGGPTPRSWIDVLANGRHVIDDLEGTSSDVAQVAPLNAIVVTRESE
jgi:hypothetical protein